MAVSAVKADEPTGVDGVELIKDMDLDISTIFGRGGSLVAALMSFKFLLFLVTQRH